MYTYFESAIYKINLVSATLFKDIAKFGKMDPYMVLEYADVRLVSNVHEGGGLNPVWNNSYFL